MALLISINALLFEIKSKEINTAFDLLFDGISLPRSYQFMTGVTFSYVRFAVHYNHQGKHKENR